MGCTPAPDPTRSDAYIALPGGRKLHPFSGGNLPMPSPLQLRVPRVFNQNSQEVSRFLVNKGCSGTARFDLIIRLGREELHTKRIEIPDGDARTEG
jgi:hypothetical protein